MTGEPTNESPNGGGVFFPGDIPEGLDCVVADIGCARHQILGYRLGYQQVWPPTTLPAGSLAVDGIKAGELFAALPFMPPVKGNVSADSKVLAALSEIKNIVSTAHPPKNVKRPGGGGGKKQKMSVDERLQALHENASELAETRTLRELGKLLGCSPSAFDGGDYYEKTLKEKRAAVRALKAMKRAGGAERYEAEDREATRANRAHAESYEDIDNDIDATWDERQGGHFSG